MATLSSSTSARDSVSFGSVVRASLIGAVIAIVVNLILWTLARVLNIPLTVVVGPLGSGAVAQALPIPPILVFSIIPAIIGGLLYFVLTKMTARGATIFTVIAVIVAVLSLLPLPGQPMSVAGMIVLALMHLFTASIITGSLTTRAKA